MLVGGGEVQGQPPPAGSPQTGLMLPPPFTVKQMGEVTAATEAAKKSMAAVAAAGRDLAASMRQVPFPPPFPHPPAWLCELSVGCRANGAV